MKKILKYLLFFIPTALVVMLLWSFVISANLFYCSDPVPFLDFLPPFVHGSQFGDYFLVNEKIVWSLWVFLVALIFLIPVRLIQTAQKKKKITIRANKKKYLTILVIGLLTILGLSGWFYILLVRSPIGPPDPSENETTNCTIQKDAMPSSFGYGQGIYTIACGKGGFYVVGESKENLDKYLENPVKLKIKYVHNKSDTDSIETNIQCIQNKCSPIFKDKDQKTYSIVIEKIQLL